LGVALPCWDARSRALFLLVVSDACCACFNVPAGSEFFKVSLVKPGMPLDIVLNIESKRKTATMVGYNDGEQLFSGAAANTVRRDVQFAC
jgi:hypoxia up-regulated 1